MKNNRNKFQFHSGSIQALHKRACGHVTLWFQFHSGSIQAKKNGLRFMTLQDVSIPLWFDSSQREHDNCPNRSRVSIPLWFDSSWTT
jgi:uncharacterized protein YfaT (DUF1175 family)